MYIILQANSDLPAYLHWLGSNSCLHQLTRSRLGIQKSSVQCGIKLFGYLCSATKILLWCRGSGLLPYFIFQPKFQGWVHVASDLDQSQVLLWMQILSISISTLGLVELVSQSLGTLSQLMSVCCYESVIKSLSYYIISHMLSWCFNSWVFMHDSNPLVMVMMLTQA